MRVETDKDRRLDVQRVVITDVDPGASAGPIARARMHGSGAGIITLDLAIGVGDRIILPNVGERWWVRRLFGRWTLAAIEDEELARNGGGGGGGGDFVTDAELAAHAAAGHSSALDDLTDVDAPSPTPGQVLTYLGTAWEPASAATATHPDLATHDSLGLTTDAELAAHEGAADPHAVYTTDAEVAVLIGAHQAGNPHEPPPPPSDGLSPSSSPAVTVTPMIGALYASWPGIANADPVTYEVHVSTSSGFTPSGATLQQLATGTAASIRTTAAGVALAAATTYYVRIVAKDDDGSAAAGAQGSGQVITIAASDGSPPGSSPAVTITTGVGFLSASWTAVANADPGDL